MPWDKLNEKWADDPALSEDEVALASRPTESLAAEARRHEVERSQLRASRETERAAVVHEREHERQEAEQRRLQAAAAPKVVIPEPTPEEIEAFQAQKHRDEAARRARAARRAW
jgi:hypothetical protein